MIASNTDEYHSTNTGQTQVAPWNQQYSDQSQRVSEESMGDQSQRQLRNVSQSLSLQSQQNNIISSSSSGRIVSRGLLFHSIPPVLSFNPH